jgi:DNA-binding HxlR family transcriptional regulator
MTKSFERVFSCPVELSLEVIGGKWKAVILAHLKEAPRTYGELRRLVPKMSDKMLTQRLAELCAIGLVSKKKRYALTTRGRSLAPVLTELYAWGESIAPTLGARIEPPAVR